MEKTEIVVQVPLCPFERTLLEGMETLYSFHSEGRGVLHLAAGERDIEGDLEACHISDTSEVLTSTIDTVLSATLSHFKRKLFTRWNWADTVESMLVSSQSEESLEDFDGDRLASIIDALRWLNNSSRGYDHQLFRTVLLREHNPGFPQSLPIEECLQLKCSPAEKDLTLWEIILCMWLSTDDSFWLFNEGPSFSAKPGFDIWKVTRTISLLRRRPLNSHAIRECLITTAIFDQKFEVRVNKVAPADETIDAEFLVDDVLEIHERKMDPSLPMAQYDDDGNLTKNGLQEFLNYMKNTKKPLDDPSKYVEIIPWSELTRISQAELASHNIDVSLPYPQASYTSEWMLWNPPSRHFFDSHHLYTEDEVYQYCVLNDWSFPGHFLAGQVVFAISSLESTRFVDDLLSFWKRWNDCSLTVEPDTNKLYLLETIPGRQYRARQDHQDEKAAFDYFRNLVEESTQNGPSNSELRALLGADYVPRYQGLLTFIPNQQLHDIDPEPLGSGANGRVFAASWTPPPKQLLCMRSETVKVVLKQIRPKRADAMRSSDNIRERFLRELDTSYAALAGSAVCCVDFLGITSLPVDAHGRLRMNESGSPSIKDELHLVFSRASEGQLFSHIEEKLQGLNETESWKVTIDMLSGLATGLSSLHKHGIIHCDLHPGNILVHSKLFPDNPGQPIEHQLLISDLGEGKRLNDFREGEASYLRAGDYMAPEVQRYNEWTKEGDVYSFGCIAKELLEQRKRICSQTESNAAEDIPKIIKDIVKQCLSEDPKKRPGNMHKVALLLNEFSSDFEYEYEQVEWDTDQMEECMSRPLESSFFDEDTQYISPM